MVDIKRLLSKKGWTGRELGILELTNTAVMFRQAVEGKQPQPIVEQAQLQTMVNSLADLSQKMVYNGYISIHEWLSIRYNIAQTQLQQAQLHYRTLSGYVTDAILAEDVYGYIERLPAIMTQKQYDDTRAERIEAHFKDEDGEDLYSNVFNLVERAISYYCAQLQSEPGKANPLKAIRKKYVNQPVKSNLVLSRWNEITGKGYYTIEDGSGRRSDQMTAEEWKKAIATPAMKKALRSMITTTGSGTEITKEVAVLRLSEKQKVIFEEDMEDAKRNTAPVKWHTAEELPTDLSKWDVIEQERLLDLYPADIDGSGDKYSESNFNASMEDFVEEFGELVAAMLKDIDKNYFKGEPGLSDIPISEWATTIFAWRQLYSKDFYGERAEVEADTTIFAGNNRAIFNGIAIIRASDLLDRSPRINGSGYYAEPDIKTTLSGFTLEAFFTEAEDYADNVDIVETARRTLMESYYSVKGYDYALELIANFYNVPDFTVFQMGVDDLEEKMRALNEFISVLYRKIHDTDYGDAELKAKKLQVLQDLFQPIDYETLVIPEENKKQAEQLLEGFTAFQPEGTEMFRNLLCVLPEKTKQRNRRTKRGG